MRHELALWGNDMSAFHRVRPERAGPQTETEDILPLGQSVLVIAALSLLSWAVLISIVVALRAAL